MLMFNAWSLSGSKQMLLDCVLLAVSPPSFLPPRASSDVLGTARVLLSLKIYVASAVGWMIESLQL